jgi:squalene cyclase
MKAAFATALAAVLVLLQAVSADPPKNPTPQEAAADQPIINAAAEQPHIDPVPEAIDRGVQYLRKEQLQDGGWEIDPACLANPGGWSSLAMLALLNAGVPLDDRAVMKGLEYLRTVKPAQTYVVALQTMVFALAGQQEDLQRIQRNADWLIRERVIRHGEFGGWTYCEADRTSSDEHMPDNSNTAYAVLGLYEAHRARARTETSIWRDIQNLYMRTQRQDGGWSYAAVPDSSSTFTMTVGGLCALIAASQELNESREKAKVEGGFLNCGNYVEDPNTARAISVLVRLFTVEERRGNVYYSLYGLGRAGRLTGLRFFGVHDWYREGCDYLLRRQDPQGSWLGRGFEHYPTVATSFAILFLSQGRRPILISKLMHGPADDWNNDHSDARNLVDFASQELFKRQPLAWEAFDAKHVNLPNGRQSASTIASELACSPVVYFNGHAAPQFTHEEEDVLRKYVEHDGFILAEACCGRRQFDEGFRDLVRRLFSDAHLLPLPKEHPVWRSHFLVTPGSFKLEGIERGGKTVLIYAPEDMSCYWESNHFSDGRAQQAFRLGANIIAYATKMTLPMPRLITPEAK